MMLQSVVRAARLLQRVISIFLLCVGIGMDKIFPIFNFYFLYAKIIDLERRLF